MAVFTSKSITVATPAREISDKFADLTRFQDVIDQIPADQRAKVGDVSFTPDTIVLHTQQVGDITLKVSQRTAERVGLTAEGSPIPMHLFVNLKSLPEGKTEMSTSMDVEIPAFAKALVGPTLQKAVDQFGDLMGRLA